MTYDLRRLRLTGTASIRAEMIAPGLSYV